ncbi:MAG: protein-L-isoaspartate O-methyltransferase [Acidobacteria bacterium]|nr:MAG: protein-L-isoaspartate O-methyltransferase [Acidobacteriota bacterium]
MCDTRAAANDPYTEARHRMARDQIEKRGVRDPRVLAAMESVPRHLFVPESHRAMAYDDGPLPIGEGQTISQPYIVAFMTEAIRPRPTDRVLEVGTGSGYQAAILASLVAEVFSLEIRPAMAESARRQLEALGCRNVIVRVGDGHHGWPGEAPFDAIVVTAAPDEVPPLLDQLRVGGTMVVPIGSEMADAQDLVRLTRTTQGAERETLLPVRFVPMTGDARRPV